MTAPPDRLPPGRDRLPASPRPADAAPSHSAKMVDERVPAPRHRAPRPGRLLPGPDRTGPDRTGPDRNGTERTEATVPTELTSVCVFCASSPGRDPRLVEAAAAFGALLARRDLALVTGGGHVGLMGAVADGALAEGGAVHGVITRALEAREVAHHGLTSLTVVDTMHERKAAMSGRADAFVMLPGGFGTLDEFFEALTWTQLGIHAKPCGVLDVAGYFGPLVDFVAGAVALGLVRAEHRDLVVVDTDPGRLLDRFARWSPVTTDKWLDRGG